jgi:tRNA uridine 5-carboxymethylaminomethyl modification enzyme
LKREEALLIPDSFDYRSVGGLSNELTQKLTAQRPGSLAQASRIEGMTPAALTLLLAHIRPQRKHG